MEGLADVTGGAADPSPSPAAPAAPAAPPAPPAPPSAALTGEVHDGPAPSSSSSSSSAAPKGKFPAWAVVLVLACLVGLVVLVAIHNRRQAAALAERGNV